MQSPQNQVVASFFCQTLPWNGLIDTFQAVKGVHVATDISITWLQGTTMAVAPRRWQVLEPKNGESYSRPVTVLDPRPSFESYQWRHCLVVGKAIDRTNHGDLRVRSASTYKYLLSIHMILWTSDIWYVNIGDNQRLCRQWPVPRELDLQMGRVVSSSISGVSAAAWPIPRRHLNELDSAEWSVPRCTSSLAHRKTSWNTGKDSETLWLQKARKARTSLEHLRAKKCKTTCRTHDELFWLWKRPWMKGIIKGSNLFQWHGHI